MTATTEAVQQLTQNTTQLLEEVRTEKGALTKAVTDAAAEAVKAKGHADNSLANAGAAAGANAESQTHRNASETAAAQALAARDQAVQAWGAATAPAEQLAAISQQIHHGTVVRAFLYDTSKDSDPKWPDRCSHTSWENEPLVSGKWLGRAANEAAARAISGAAAGDYFQSTTDGRFYSLSGSAGVAEVFRGNRRKHPALTAILAEAGRVIYYDITEQGCPMWMVFRAEGGVNWWNSGTTVTSITAVQGLLLAGSNGGGMRFVDFLADRLDVATSASGPRPSGGISTRNAATVFGGERRFVIASHLINDLAAAVLPGSPLDPATGLQTPTIAVFTAGGVSVIQNNGTVANSATTNSFAQGAIGSDGALFAGRGGAGHGVFFARGIGSLTSGFALTAYYGQNLAPALPMPVVAGDATNAVAAGSEARLFRGGNLYGIQIVKENPAAKERGMVAGITTTYNTGWLVGDNRLATLADTVAETVAGQTVADEKFDYPDAAALAAAGWTAVSGGVLSINAGALRVTVGTEGNFGAAQKTWAVMVGKHYRISGRRVNGSGSGTQHLHVGTPSSFTAYAANRDLSLGAFSFQATDPTLQIRLNAVGSTQGAWTEYDDLLIELVEADRSSRNVGLTIKGTLTKTAVAQAAQLVAYSGWSAANHVQQPYNAALDFGVGEWTVGGWLQTSGNAPMNGIACSDASAATVGVWTNNATLGLPNGWRSNVISGLTREVVAKGTLPDGTKFVDIRWHGTNNTGSLQYPDLYFTDGQSLVPTVGQTWTASVKTQLLAGALPAGGGSGGLSVAEFNSGTFLTGSPVSEGVNEPPILLMESREAVGGWRMRARALRQWATALGARGASRRELKALAGG